MDYKRYGKYLKLDFISESFYAKSYKSKFFGTDNFYKIFSFDEISEQITEDPIIFNEFMKIIKANSKLNHSNIVRIIDFHDFHSTYALITEYFPHEQLLVLMASFFKRKKKIPVVVAVYIISQACDAVGYAHTKRILHGNLTPLNIQITHEGIIKVKEFSFFNNLSVSTNIKALNFKQFRYIAPEKFIENRIYPQSDVYSLAVILYEMLTGKTLYSSKDMNTLIEKIKEGGFTPIRELNPEIPDELAQVVEKALNTDHKKRYEDPIKFKYAIQKFLIKNDKIFSSQHFYTLISKIFSSSITREIEQNASYANLHLEDFENLLKEDHKKEEEYQPDIDEDLFEDETESTSILYDNVDEIEFIEEEKAEEDSYKNNVDPSLYEENESTMLFDEDEDEDEEKEESSTNVGPDNQIPENLIKKLDNPSNFNLKSFIIGLVTGLFLGLIFSFLK